MNLNLYLNRFEAEVVAKTIRAMRLVEFQTNFEMHSLVCPNQLLTVMDAPDGDIFIGLLVVGEFPEGVEHHAGIEAFELAYGLVPTLTEA